MHRQQLTVKPLAFNQLVNMRVLTAPAIGRGRGRGRLFLKPTESEISERDERALRENLVEYSSFRQS